MRFFLVDRIRSYDPGGELVAVKNVTLEAHYFDQHFPGNPVLPGVLTVEAMAQASGFMVWRTARLREGRAVVPLLHTITRARFTRMVRPGDQLVIQAGLVSLHPSLAVARVSAQVEGEPAARGELQFVLSRGDAASEALMDERWALLSGGPTALEEVEP